MECSPPPRRACRVQTWFAWRGRCGEPSSVTSIGGVSASPVASIHGASASRIAWVGWVLALPRHAQKETSGVQTGVQAIRGRARGLHLIAEVGAQRTQGSRKRRCGHGVDGRHPGSWKVSSLNETAVETGLGGAPARGLRSLQRDFATWGVRGWLATRPDGRIRRRERSARRRALDQSPSGPHGAWRLGNTEAHWRSCQSWKLVVKRGSTRSRSFASGPFAVPEPRRLTAFRYERGSCVPQRKRGAR